MNIYNISDRVFYNPTYSYDKKNFQYGTIRDIDDIYLYIQFDNNPKIFKLLAINVCIDNKCDLLSKFKKIVITI
jgi:hypothetical protein